MSDAPREAFPLTWPAARRRTPPGRRVRSKFQILQFSRARDMLVAEVNRLGACNLIISTDVPTRNDGLPYANMREPNDPGVAAYFQNEGEPFVIACDSYDRVAANMRAVGATIEALRAIERHGSASMMAQAFTGFAALPPARIAEPSWWEVLGVDSGATFEELRDARDRLAMRAHPDMVGGNHEEMARINRAYERACEEKTG
jgi:hypothetical protein